MNIGDLQAFASDSVVESIWVPSRYDSLNNHKFSDTTKGEINLIFEMQFDDSVQIFLNQDKIASQKIKTNSNFSAVERVFSINHSLEKNPLITIYTVDKNRKVSFHPKAGYLFGYINRLDTLWTIEYSNYQREYY